MGFHIRTNRNEPLHRQGLTGANSDTNLVSRKTVCTNNQHMFGLLKISRRRMVLLLAGTLLLVPVLFAITGFSSLSLTPATRGNAEKKRVTRSETAAKRRSGPRRNPGQR